MLRSELQADLAELHARGEELLLRYDSAAGLEGLPAGFSADLRRIAAERRGWVDALAALERAHEDLPKAGNPERASSTRRATPVTWRGACGPPTRSGWSACRQSVRSTGPMRRRRCSTA